MKGSNCTACGFDPFRVAIENISHGALCFTPAIKFVAFSDFGDIPLSEERNFRCEDVQFQFNYLTNTFGTAVSVGSPKFRINIPAVERSTYQVPVDARKTARSNLPSPS